jgi:uncharacterized membrane protein YhaH (DUF805 family)/uncharacterized Zn finger protein (UPF0148 family)
MSVRSLTCPSCAAPVQVLPNTGRVQCPYCTTPLVVEQTGAEATLQLAERIETSTLQTRDAIESGTAVTQAELRRLQLSHELSAAQLRLAGLQGEIRAIQRLPSSGVTRRQLQDLHQQETQILQQIHGLNQALNPGVVAVHANPPTPKAAFSGKSLAALFFSPAGRIGRGQFWLGVAIVFVVFLLLVALIPSPEEGTGSPLAGFAVLALMWCSFAVAAKRYHDLDKAAWWSLVILIPVIGWVWIVIDAGLRPGTPGPNRYG